MALSEYPGEVSLNALAGACMPAHEHAKASMSSGPAARPAENPEKRDSFMLIPPFVVLAQRACRKTTSQTLPGPFPADKPAQGDVLPSDGRKILDHQL
jgi:hypothetical protein